MKTLGVCPVSLGEDGTATIHGWGHEPVIVLITEGQAAVLAVLIAYRPARVPGPVLRRKSGYPDADRIMTRMLRKAWWASCLDAAQIRGRGYGFCRSLHDPARIEYEYFFKSE